MEKPKTILVIDDDVFLGDAISQKLRTEGFDPVVVKDGAEGFRRIKELKPSLILLDVELPSMDGYSILAEKQKDDAIRAIPVIVISNSGQTVEIKKILELGAVGYFVKADFNLDEVVARVRKELSASISTEAFDAPHDNQKKNGAFSLSGKKILWVEDDKFLGDIIARKLSREGCELFHADNGEEALKLVKNEKPDIVLLDILLSGVDGFEILRKIKEDAETKHIPVILLSNLGQRADIDRGTALGAARFLVKATVTLDEIVLEIKKIFAGGSK